ncbi:MAG: DUF3126 family protein [Pseudomonadota bacterium]
MSFKDDHSDLTRFLRKRFNTEQLTVRLHEKKTDFAEIYVGEEFIATLNRVDEDGEVEYHFQMAILDMDLAEV